MTHHTPSASSSKRPCCRQPTSLDCILTRRLPRCTCVQILTNDIRFPRRRAWRRRKAAAVVHLDVAALTAKVTLCRAARLAIATGRLVVVGWGIVAAALLLTVLLTVLRLLSVVVGVVLRLAAHGSHIARPSGAVEGLATGLATTARADASREKVSMAPQCLEDCADVRDQEEEDECRDNNDGQGNPAAPVVPCGRAAVCSTIAVATVRLARVELMCSVHDAGGVCR